MAVLYGLVFVISFLAYPEQLFGNSQKYGVERGFQRISLIGDGFLFLFSFYILGKYLEQRKLSSLIYFLITIVLIIMGLSRVIIASSVFVFSIFILRKSTLYKKMLAILLIAVSMFVITKMNFYKLMLDETMSQVNYINDDIRIMSAYYYLNHFSQYTFTKIFGNGDDYMGTKYANSMDFIEKGLGLYTVDIGYIGLYAKFGILAILAYIILVFKTIKIRVDEEYLYCKYFLYFVFIISIVIDSTFSISFIPAIVVSLYILTSQEKKHLNLEL